MKDFSLFLLKNYLGAKMKGGFRSSCNGHGSTSTLDQQPTVKIDHPLPSPCAHQNTSPTTLEDMILQLEIEEEMARRAKLNGCYDDHNAQNRRITGRMSCVNSSDILRSARNALNQYPRFSLDGKDAMYRSSFRIGNDQFDSRKSTSRPSAKKTTTSRRREKHGVVWCEPGVVAKLMGLDAIPVPVKKRRNCCEERMRRQNFRNRSEMNRRDGFGRLDGVEMSRRDGLGRLDGVEMNRRDALGRLDGVGMNGCDGPRRRIMDIGPSYSKGGYLPPSGVYPGGGWPTVRFM